MWVVEQPRRAVLFGTGTAFLRFRPKVLRVEKRESKLVRSSVYTRPDMSLARLQRSNLAIQLPLALTIGNLKNVIFYYLLVKYTLKCWRRLVALGPVQAVVDGWRWLSLVRSLCISISMFKPLHPFLNSVSSSSLCVCRPPEQR